MSDAQLRFDIELWLYENARGHENAKPRRYLRQHLRSKMVELGHSLPRTEDGLDRAMRKAKAGSEKIGSCLNGYFYIVTIEDRHITEGHLHGRAMSELVREKNIREKALPEGAQGELF